jgi:hypothetical protein
VARDPRLHVAGRLATSAAGRLLVSYLIGAIVITVVASLGGGVLGIDFNPVVLVLGALAGAVLLWFLAVIEGWAPPMHWEDIRFPTSSLHVGSDNRTRRLASLIAASDPTHRMGQRPLRDLLAELAASRLVRSHAADPQHPFATPALSPGLRSYLTSPDHAVPSLRRRTLQTYLEEISRL